MSDLVTCASCSAWGEGKGCGGSEMWASGMGVCTRRTGIESRHTYKSGTRQRACKLHIPAEHAVHSERIRFIAAADARLQERFADVIPF